MTTTTCRTKHLSDEAGARAVYRNALTGEHVVVYEGDEAMLDTDGGRWSNICEAHAECVAFETLAQAKEFAANPAEWCEECAAVAGVAAEMPVP